MIGRGEVVLAADAYALIGVQGSQVGVDVPEPTPLQAATEKRLAGLAMAAEGRPLAPSPRVSSLDPASHPSGEADALESALESPTRQPGSEFLLDKETVRLAAAVVCRRHAGEPAAQSVAALKASLDAAGVDHRGCREKSELVARVEQLQGLHRALRFDDCGDLDHHGALLRQGGGKARHALATAVRVLQRGLGEEGPCLSEDELGRLLLRIKYNAHPVLDGATQSRRCGLGLYPAACYLNHSCFPNTCYHTTNLGQTMVFRF